MYIVLVKNFKLSFFLSFVAFGLIVASIASIMGYWIHSQHNQEQFRANADLVSKNKKVDFLKSHIDRMDSQVNAISGTKALGEFIQKPDANKKAKLIDIFFPIAVSDKQIMQVRFIDAAGMEKVRIDRNTVESEPFVVEESKLQDKSGRDYFKIVSRMTSSKIWRSSLDLNIEHGKVEVPYRPTFRVAKPIFVDQKFSGMVIINLLVDNLIDNLGQSEAFEHYIVDKNGYFLVHPDKNLCWSRYTNKTRLQDTFGEIGAKIMRSEQVATNIFVFSLEDVLQNGEDIRLILKPKAQYQKSLSLENIQTTLITFVLCVILGIPIAFYLAIAPSNLQKSLFATNTKLKESESRLQAIIENEPECIKIVDEQYKVLQMNPAGLKMVEADSFEQIEGKNVLGVIAPEYREAFKELHRKVLAGESAYMQFETQGIKGGKRWLETHAVPMQDGDKIVHLAVTRDITDRKAEEEFRNLLLSSLGDGVYGIDMDGKCTFINTAALKMLGYEENEVLGFDQHELFHHTRPDGSPYLKSECPIHLTVGDGRTRESEDVFINKSGKHFDTHLKVSPIIKDNSTIGAVVVFQDITERLAMQENLRSINKHLSEMVKEETDKRIEKEKLLIQQSKMAVMGEMIGAIAHQWRQPLNSLGMTVQDVEMAYKFGELDEKYLANYKSEAMRIIQTMSSTIDDFKNFFSANKKQEDFYIEDAINDVLKMLSAQFKINNVEILFTINEANKHMYTCYKNELKQVLLNILANAKDALFEKKPEQPYIKIDIAHAVDALTISVEDSAGGIPHEIVDKIFEPYFTTKAADKGTGIGLYMSKEIIENSLNGKIYIENASKGARFTIKLPIEKA